MPLSDQRILVELDKLDDRLRSLEGWQRDVSAELRELELELHRIAPLVDQMREADKVSEALAEAARATKEAARETSRIHLSRGQFATAIVVATVALGGFVLQLIHAVTR